MKVLVIGSGGREHAIAYKLKQSPKVSELYAIPGNPGIASLGTCVPGSVEDNEFIVDFIQKNQIDLTVIGPEVPLCNGLADDIEKAGYKDFGPQKKAATLEGSKAFSKDFMIRHHIPTAKYVEVTDFEKACKEVDHFDFPLVIKADGLAAGKGVVIVENKEDLKPQKVRIKTVTFLPSTRLKNKLKTKARFMRLRDFNRKYNGVDEE